MSILRAAQLPESRQKHFFKEPLWLGCWRTFQATSMLCHYYHITFRCEVSFPYFPGLGPGQDE